MIRAQRGFTIVELALVLLVMAALSTIGVVSYRGSQDRARDAKMLDAVDKIKDSVVLFASNQGHFPTGGSGSNVAIGAGTECSNGSGLWFGVGNYTCTLENTLVASGYLPSGFSSDLKYNPDYPNTNKSILVYQVNATSRTAIIFYSLIKPTSTNTTHKTAEVSKCGYTMTSDDTAMEDAICFNY